MRLDEVASHKLPDNAEEIKHLVNSWGFKKIKINSDGRVDVTGSVDLHAHSPMIEGKNLKRLPFKFGLVRGDFILHDLTDLESFEELPTKVTGDFSILNSNISSLKGVLPKTVGKDLFFYSLYKLSSLEGLSEIDFTDALSISDIPNLKSLDGIPSTLENTRLQIINCPITSLKGIPSIVKDQLALTGLKELKSLDYLPKEMTGSGVVYLNELKATNLLKIFQIKGAKRLIFLKNLMGTMTLSSMEALSNIVSKHLKTGDMIECQEELIEAGFKDYARLR